MIAEPKSKADDTIRLIEGVPAATDAKGNFDKVGHEINFLEDFLGRFNNTIDPVKAKMDIAMKLLKYIVMDRDLFISKAREHIGVEDDLFDRFLTHVWGNYISKIDKNINVLTSDNVGPVFEIYRQMMKDLEVLRESRFVRNWPYPIPDDAKIGDF